MAIALLSKFKVSFSVECVSQYWVGRSNWKEKKKLKKNHKKSRNRRPWYPRTTLKVNIHIFGLTKCTIYCKKCSCLCSCFSLCCYYAHFAAILITFCVHITFCGDYYILRRNTQSSAGSRLSDLRVNLWLRRCRVSGLFKCLAAAPIWEQNKMAGVQKS